MQAAKPSSDASIYQLKVTLHGVRPPIWRRVQVRSDITLAKLHAVIQEAMGWTNSHLHRFMIAGEEYGQPDPDFAEEGLEFKNERTIKLGRLELTEGATFLSAYDF